MAELPETIIEERQETTVTPKGRNPVQKTTHFIKPILSLTDKPQERPSLYLPFRPIFPKVTFNGWRNPTQQWCSWVDQMHSSYKFIWKSAGICEAIMCSRYKIMKSEELFLGLAETWCSETNTFVFPWGEASFTLEDVMILGGYSVTGDSVSGSGKGSDFVEAEKKLVKVHEELSRGKSQRALQSLWLKHFMGNGSEVEHEAFLALWLSRFVFPLFPFDVVSRKFLKMAVWLARGTKLALGPVVLASIYRDLSLLKSVMESGNDQVKGNGCKGDGFDDVFVLTLWAPLHLVQVWAWERFPEFRPNPSTIVYGEPRLARWHGVKEIEMGNVRHVLQSAGDTFVWRPYCERVDNWPLPEFYSETELWVVVKPDLVEEFQTLARLLRVCEMVGMDSVERYNPHRVAMQFGFDQDIPQHVSRWLIDSDISRREAMQLAWISYTNSVKDPILYVPARSYEPRVTTRYLDWLRQGACARTAAFEGVVRKRRSSKRSRRSTEPKKDMVFYGSEDDVFSGFSPKTIDVHVPPGFSPRNDGNDSDVPLGFLPNADHEVRSNAVDSVEIGLLGMLKPSVKVKQETGESLQTFNNQEFIYVPPGFSPKNVGNAFNIPPGFKPKINHEVRQQEAVETDENGLSEMVKLSVEQRQGDGVSLPRSNVQELSAFPSKIEHNGEAARGGTPSVKSEPVMSGSKGGNEHASDNTNTNGAQTVANGRDVHRCRHDSVALDLIARMRRLERVVSALKKATSMRLPGPA